MRFPAFQKLEEVAVAANTPTIVVKPIEEVAVAETTPQPTEYEVLRANAIAERERFCINRHSCLNENVWAVKNLMMERSYSTNLLLPTSSMRWRRYRV
ncbi:MAG: hypothetical protein J6A35_06390 [Paludibacteraceae bacterium]|nr:hypothetical protein [Paludibacteraceae bacterium]